MRNRIFALMKKEMFHILRDARSLYLALILPILLLILFGYAITFDIHHLPIGIVDQDSTFLSRDLISRFRSSEYFDIRFISEAGSGFERFLDEGRIKIILVIPYGFSRDFAREKEIPLQLLIDGSDSNTAQIAMGYISRLIQIFSSNIILEKLNKQSPTLHQAIPAINVERRVWYNPDLRSPNFIVPGLIAVVMMILTALLTSLTIAREWESGTMEQLISSPAKPYEIIIGKLMPYFFLGMIQISLVILTGTLLFHVPFRGNLFFLFIASAIFLVCGLGIGLLISTISKSQQLAFMLSILSTLLPSFLLSGFIFPISSMPPIIQFFTYLVPAKYFLVILRGIFLKGNGLVILWPQVLALILFASFFVLASTKRLKLSLE